MQAEVCWAWTARSKGVFPGVIYGLALAAAPQPSVTKTLARSRSLYPALRATWQSRIAAAISRSPSQLGHCSQPVSTAPEQPSQVSELSCLRPAVDRRPVMADSERPALGEADIALGRWVQIERTTLANHSVGVASWQCCVLACESER